MDGLTKTWCSGMQPDGRWRRLWVVKPDERERSMIRKLGLLVPSAVCLIVVLAAPALAGSELPPPDDPNVQGVVVQPPGAGATGGIAFTGGNVRMWMVLAAALLVVGVTLLIAGRRSRANAAP